MISEKIDQVMRHEGRAELKGEGEVAERGKAGQSELEIGPIGRAQILVDHKILNRAVERLPNPRQIFAMQSSKRRFTTGSCFCHADQAR